MRKSFVALLSLALFFGVLLTVGCGGGGGGGGTSPVTPIADGSLADLNGKVTYLGKPVANAAVYLIKVTDQQSELSRRASLLTQPEPDFSVLTADGNGYQTTSDANGNYTFAQVPVGTYTLDASISPTIRVSQSVVVGAISNLDLALKPTGNISGKIILDGSPVQAMVFLQGTSYIGITDLAGSFTIMNVPVETTPYTLIPVMQNNYYPKSVRVAPAVTPIPGQMPAASPQPETLAVHGDVRASYGSVYTFKNSPVLVTPVAGTNTDLGTLELIAAVGTLTGTALIEGSNMHSGIYVSTSGSSAYTDSEGKYTLENVDFGQRTIYFTKYAGSDHYAASTSILVDSVTTKTIETVTLRTVAPTTGNISGTVSGIVAPGGQTQSPNGTIYLYQNGTQVDSQYLYISGTSATYNFSEVATGTYSVVIPAYNNYLLASAAITIAAGDDKTQNFTLSWTKAAVSGTVTGVDSSHPTAVSLFQNGSLVTYSSNLSNNSTYNFIVNPGVYSVSVDTMSGYAAASYAVTLAAGNQKTQNFTLTQTFPILSTANFNTPGTQITVTGSRFTANSAILIDGSPVSTSYVSATQLTGVTSGINPGLHEVSISNQGVMSNVLSGIPKQFTASPTITAGTLGMTSYTLNWNPLSGATSGYTVYMNGVSLTTTADNSYTFTGLAPNTSYTFGVEATGYSSIFASPRAVISVTTSRVFNTPQVYNSNYNIGDLVRSFMFEGYLYAIGTSGTTPAAVRQIIRYDLSNPGTFPPAPQPLTDPFSGYGSITDLYVDSSGVYIGWVNSSYGPTVYLQRYTLNVSAPYSVQNTYSAGFTSTALGIKVKGNNDPLNSGPTLQAISWDNRGVASLTYLSNTLSVVGTPKTITLSNTEKLEWASFMASGNVPRTAILTYTYSEFESCSIFDADPGLTTLQGREVGATPSDITGSPNLGFAMGIDSSLYYVANGITHIPACTQVAFDNKNRLYTLTSSEAAPPSIARFSSVGNREDGIVLDSTPYPDFGIKLIHYDATNQQIVVLAHPPAPDDSNLGVMIFKIQD